MAEETKDPKPTVPYQVIELGEEELRLRFQVSSIREAQRVSGKAFGQLLGASLVFDVEAIHFLLWASLRWQKPKLTLNQSEAILQKLVDNGRDLQNLAQELATAAKKSGFIVAKKGPSSALLGDDDEESEGNPEAERSESG